MIEYLFGSLFRLSPFSFQSSLPFFLVFFPHTMTVSFHCMLYCSIIFNYIFNFYTYSIYVDDNNSNHILLLYTLHVFTIYALSRILINDKNFSRPLVVSNFLLRCKMKTRWYFFELFT